MARIKLVCDQCGYMTTHLGNHAATKANDMKQHHKDEKPKHNVKKVRE